MIINTMSTHYEEISITNPMILGYCLPFKLFIFSVFFIELSSII